MTLRNVFVAFYLTAAMYQDILGLDDEQFVKFKDIVYGYFKWHQDRGFGGASGRFLISFGDSKEGKKMMFVDRKTNRWYVFYAPCGTIVHFSREGGGVLEKSSIFHKIVDGAGTITFAGEGKYLGGDEEEIEEGEDHGIV